MPWRARACRLPSQSAMGGSISWALEGGTIPGNMLHKRWVLMVISVLIVAAIVVLGASLHDVRFEPGTPLAMRGAVSPPVDIPPITRTLAETPLWKILLLW